MNTKKYYNKTEKLQIAHKILKKYQENTKNTK